MSYTAQEILMKDLMSHPKVAKFTRHFEVVASDMAIYGTHVAIGRRVSANRARKLRRRGESVCFVGKTTTGKFVYTWRLRIDPLKIYR